MFRVPAVLAVVSVWCALLSVGEARADGCTDLGGDVVGSECRISDSVKRSGIYTITQRTLRIEDGGKITVPVASGGASLTINVCGAPELCDFIMEPGSEINGNAKGTGTATGIGATININATRHIELQGTGKDGALISSNQSAGSCTAGGRGGNINLVAGFDIGVDAGSAITADGKPCPGGAIKLIAAQGKIETDGFISSMSTLSGTGAIQAPGGGPVTLIARCDLTAGGVIQSKGLDAGADLVHLEAGCSVVVDGLVQSTGAGHAVPNTPGNHCYGPDFANPGRPDKPKNSSACVEIWSGRNITITADGEVNADTGSPGGNVGTSWIDVFARGPIAINGNTSAPFAVHANGLGGSGGPGENGGIVTVKSIDGPITAKGKALQASANNNSGDDGGQIVVEAGSFVSFEAPAPTLEAKGRHTGGSIAARSFTSALTWVAGVGDVRPNPSGKIGLKACTTVTTTGTNFNGTIPTKAVGVCSPTSPTLPSYVVLPTCVCVGPGPGVPCPQDRFRVLTWTVDPAGPRGAVPNSTTLQEAVANASSGHIIGVFGKTIDNVNIQNKGFTITQCTVGLIEALDGSKPVVAISSPDPNIVIGMDTSGGTVGWLLASSGNELRGVRASGASESGIQIKGDGNRVSWNAVRQNGGGIGIDGDNNDLRGGGAIEGNTGDGVFFSSTASGNILQGSTIQDNGGNGVNVAGSGNTIRDNSRIDHNGKNGILVTGANNVLKSNTTGSSAGKGNLQDGIRVTGAGNSLDGNRASANGGDGFDISGGTPASPNLLKGSQSNQNNSGSSKENKGAEYVLSNSVKNIGSNKADNVDVPKSTKCKMFPAKGKIVTFATTYSCGD